MIFGTSSIVLKLWLIAGRRALGLTRRVLKRGTRRNWRDWQFLVAGLAVGVIVLSGMFYEASRVDQQYAAHGDGGHARGETDSRN